MKCRILIACMLLFALTLQAQIKSPKDFFGFAMGADRKLARYDRISEYFSYVARHSDRVITDIAGKTTLGNSMVVAVISQKDNISHLKEHLKMNRGLALGEADALQAKAFSLDSRAVVCLCCNQHSTEIGSSQSAVQLLYDLAVSTAPEVRNILDNVILVLIPSTNPDGQIMVVDWYRKYLGTKYEGGSLPFLYHHYAGHDNNRDWYKQNLQETRLVSKLLYFRYFPQIVIDLHQMGSSGDRLYVPPFQDPLTPEVHPLVWRTINVLGSDIGFELQRQGMSGVASRGFFSGWWLGGTDDTACQHNMAGLLFETASVKIASSVYVEPEEVRSGESRLNEGRIFSPDPWSGGVWTLADIVRYNIRATMSVLGSAAEKRQQLLLNSYKMARDNIKKGETLTPRCYMIPLQQHDLLRAEKLVRTMLMANVRVFRLKNSLTTENRFFARGSFCIPLNQAFRSFAKNMLSVQHYPDLRRNREDRPMYPYDAAAWTLQYAMGVNACALNEPLDSNLLEEVSLQNVYKRDYQESKKNFLVLDSRENTAFAAVFFLLKKGVTVYRNKTCPDLNPGDFVVLRKKAEPVLRELLKKVPLSVKPVTVCDLDGAERIRLPRIALYQNWGGNMREGWMRYVFDEFKIPYTTVHNRDLQKKSFPAVYDVLVINHVNRERLLSGKLPERYRQWYTPLPAPFSGGIGETGRKNISKMLDTGKTLVFCGRSCDFAIKEFSLPVRNVSSRLKIKCPGSYVNAVVKKTALTKGMETQIRFMFSAQDPVFATSLPASPAVRRRTALVFPPRGILASGWLENESELARKSLVVRCEKKGGNVVLIGPDLIYRAQSEGTYKIIFNSLLLN